MKDFKDQFSILKDELALTSEERGRIRAHLVSLMETQAPVAAPIKTPFAFFFTQQRMVVAFALILLIGGTGTASAAARGALPGDVLYGVKVGFNEPIERAAALSERAKAYVDIKQAEERLKEVVILAARGDADLREVIDIAADVEERTLRADAAAQVLAAEGDTEEADRIETRIAASLAAHADILEAQARQYGDEKERRLKALSVALSVTANDVANEDDDEDAQKLAASREKDALKRIEDLREELEENRIPEDTKNALLRELAEIETEFGIARTLSASEDYVAAASAYANVERRAYRTEALLTSALRIDGEGKDVYIRFGREGEPVRQAKGTEDSAAGTSLLMMAEDNSGSGHDDDEDHDDDDDDEDDHDDEDDESDLEFRIEDRDD